MILRGPTTSGFFYLVGISTKFTAPAGRLMISLPWAEGGHHITGLWEECAIKCWWVDLFDVQRIIRRIDVMPPDIAERVVEYVTTAVQEGLVRIAK